MIIDAGKFKEEPIFESPRKGDIERSVADITKAKKIGFKPRTDLRKDFKEVFELIEV